MQQFKVISFKGLKLLYLQEIIKIAILFFAIQLLLVYLNVSLYISCIYCPLIFLYKRNVNHRFINDHNYLLIYIHIFFYLLVVTLSLLGYDRLFLWGTLLYFLVYAVLINLELRKPSQVAYFRNSKHLISLFIYFIILAICVFVLRLVEDYYGRIFSFSTRFIIMGALVMNILFSIVSLISLRRVEFESTDEKAMDINSELGLLILDFFNNSKAYLKPNFTITNLATSLDVRKEAVSEVVNREMKISFYNLVAKYRIEYAKQILLTQEHMTIESIVDQCGFHSRTTFNKYFLKYVGVKPSEFRKAHLTKIEKLN